MIRKNALKRVVYTLVLIVGVIGFIGGIILSQRTFADTNGMADLSDVEDKFYANGLYQCIKNGQLNATVDTTGEEHNTSDISSGSLEVPLISSAQGDSASCKELIAKIGNKRVNSSIGEDGSLGQTALIEYLEKLGYGRMSYSDNKYVRCLKLTFGDENITDDVESQTICTKSEMIDNKNFNESLVNSVFPASSNSGVFIEAKKAGEKKSLRLKLKACERWQGTTDNCVILMPRIELDVPVLEISFSNNAVGEATIIETPTQIECEGFLSWLYSVREDVQCEKIKSEVKSKGPRKIILIFDENWSETSINERIEELWNEHDIDDGSGDPQPQSNSDIFKYSTTNVKDPRYNAIFGGICFDYSYPNGGGGYYCTEKIEAMDVFVGMGSSSYNMGAIYSRIENALLNNSKRADGDYLVINGQPTIGIPLKQESVNVFDGSKLGDQQDPIFKVSLSDLFTAIPGTNINTVNTNVINRLFGESVKANTDSYGVKLTSDELYTLYSQYIKDSCKIRAKEDIDDTTITESDSGWTPVALVNGEHKFSIFYVTPKSGFGKSTDKNFNGVKEVKDDNKPKGYYLNNNIKNVSLQEIIDILNKFCDIKDTGPILGDECYMRVNADRMPVLDKNNLYDGEFVPQIEQDDDEGSGQIETEHCYADSGSMGWLICPVAQAMGFIGEHLWNQIEGYLQIPTNIFDDNSGVKPGWDVVITIANVAFIIVFLIVIFSQLTGKGIDNYGIKKMLPRLITVVILMNLSYIICELAVDLSNIFGIGLNDLLSGASSRVAGMSGAVEGGGAGGWLLATVLAGGGFAIYTQIRGGLGSALSGLGIAIVGLVIVIVAAMVTLYFILVARQAGVVIAIILAPLAILCYALPNTEKIYKNWFNMFKALLLVYPICGAMVGGGQLAGSVLARANMGVAAMIIQVLPFFLVPSVLKKSLSALGNIGGRISALGKSWGQRGSRGAKSLIGESSGYKNLVKEGQQRRQERQEEAARRAAARTMERLAERKRRNGGVLNQRDMSRLKRAQDAVLAGEKKDSEAELAASDEYMGAMRTRQDMELDKERHTITNQYANAKWVSAQRAKTNLERMNEDAVVKQYNDQSYRRAEELRLNEKTRRQASEARLALARHDYKDKNLDELSGMWEKAYRDGNMAELDALTNLMVERYEPEAVKRMSNVLQNYDGVNNKGSIEQLRETMTYNSALAKTAKRKNPDMFNMINDGGAKAFSEYTNDLVLDKMEDIVPMSGAALDRAIDAGVIGLSMAEQILNSDSELVKSNLSAANRKKLENYVNKANNIATMSDADLTQGISNGTIDLSMADRILNSDNEYASNNLTTTRRTALENYVNKANNIATMSDADLTQGISNGTIDLPMINQVLDSGSKAIRKNLTSGRRDTLNNHRRQVEEQIAQTNGPTSFPVHNDQGNVTGNVNIYTPPSRFSNNQNLSPEWVVDPTDPAKGNFIYTNSKGEKWNGSTGKWM